MAFGEWREAINYNEEGKIGLRHNKWRPLSFGPVNKNFFVGISLITKYEGKNSMETLLEFINKDTERTLVEIWGTWRISCKMN